MSDVTEYRGHELSSNPL